MKNWQERFDDVHRKFVDALARKEQTGESAKKQIDKIYREFFTNQVTSAFKIVEKKLTEKYDVKLFIPKDDEYGYYILTATLSIYKKGQLSSNELSGHGAEIYQYKINAQIFNDEVVLGSSHHFVYRDDVKREPRGDIIDRTDYGQITVEDICNDVIHGYERMVDDSVY